MDLDLTVMEGLEFSASIRSNCLKDNQQKSKRVKISDVHSLKMNIAPEKWGLGDYFPLAKAQFHFVSFRVKGQASFQ